MQDGAAQSNQEPTMIPLEDPSVDPVTEVAGPVGTPLAPQQPTQSNPGQGLAPKSDEGVDYWRNEAIKNREAAAKFNAYQGLIGYLEESPETVDQLEQVITGRAADLVAARQLAAQRGGQQFMSEEERLANELGMGDQGQQRAGANPNQQNGRQKTVEELIAEAEVRARTQERIRMEFDNFKVELMETGVPDHAIDEFTQFLQNPSALTFADLFTAYNSVRQAQGNTPLPTPPRRVVQARKPQDSPNVPANAQHVPTGMPPVGVEGMPGTSTRPGDLPRHVDGNGTRQVQSPNEI